MEKDKLNEFINIWSSAPDLGIPSQDYQHHYFFILVRRIVETLKDGHESDYLHNLFSELNQYARFHFRSEELMMKSLEFPGFDAHRIKHTDLLEELSIREGELAMDFSNEKIFELLDFLSHWFSEHTETVDKEFADYVLGHPLYKSKPNLF